MPNTVNRALITPTTGSLPNAWGTSALNVNFTSMDGIVGGVQTVSLSASNVSLTASTTSITPGAGPFQADNFLIKFTGTISTNVVVTFPMPGFYIVSNNCVGNFWVKARASGTGNVIGLPPGKAIHIWTDGTNCDFANMPDVGSFMDLAVSTTPVWFNACTVLPWLLCDGSTYSTASYTALAAMLGSTFGGNGSSTFGVPDLQSRVRVALATAGVGRITFGVAGFTSTVWGAAGGSQNPQTHSHAASVTDPGHTHNYTTNDTTSSGTAGGTTQYMRNPTLTATVSGTTGISVSIGSSGSGSSGNMQPTLVHGITLIKT